MQTFVPYDDFVDTAHCLDNKRLFKQAVEVKQIYLALTVPGYGWQSHPAVRMWEGCEFALLTYGRRMVLTHLERGYKAPVLMPWYEETMKRKPWEDRDHELPFWWSDDRVHDSHKAMLYHKDPWYYGDFEEFSHIQDYFWPTQERQP